MALGILSNKTSPRCYTIVELLDMRHTLLYVSFPVKNFKPEVWNEMVLTDAVITLTLSVFDPRGNLHPAALTNASGFISGHFIDIFRSQIKATMDANRIYLGGRYKFPKS